MNRRSIAVLGVLVISRHEWRLWRPHLFEFAQLLLQPSQRSTDAALEGIREEDS